jgi:hypothetical protein
MDMFQEKRISKNVLYVKGDRNYSDHHHQNWKNKSGTMPHTWENVVSYGIEEHWETDTNGVTCFLDNMLKGVRYG